MSGEKAKWTKTCVAALYALTMIFVAFVAASPHERPSSGDPGVYVASDAVQSLFCHSGDHEGGGGDQAMSCCDACILSGTPGLNVVATTHLVHSLEVSTRIAFASRLGRIADATPDNIRSRAPPRLA
jgi:hypothetical protein